MKFYYNEKEDTWRIVKDLHNGYFSVVKLVKPGVYTLKLWRGDLNTTAKFWNTKFVPSCELGADLMNKLVKAYHDVVNKMQHVFSKL